MNLLSRLTHVYVSRENVYPALRLLAKPDTRSKRTHTMTKTITAIRSWFTSPAVSDDDITLLAVSVGVLNPVIGGRK